MTRHGKASTALAVVTMLLGVGCGPVARGEEGCEPFVPDGEWVLQLGLYGGFAGDTDVYVVRADGTVDLFDSARESFVETLPISVDAEALRSELEATGVLDADEGCYDVGDEPDPDGSGFSLALRDGDAERFFAGDDGGDAPDEVHDAVAVARERLLPAIDSEASP